MVLMLLGVHAEDIDGDDDNDDGNNDNDAVASCCCCFPLTCQTLPPEKSRVLWEFQTKR